MSFANESWQIQKYIDTPHALQIIASTFWSAAQRDPSSKCFPSASAPLSLPSLVGHDRLSQVVIMDGLRMTGQRHPLKELIDKQNPADRLSQVVIMDGLRMTGQRHPLKELIDKQNPCVNL